MPTPFELYDQAADRRDQGDKEGAVAKLEEAVALDPEASPSRTGCSPSCMPIWPWRTRPSPMP